MVISLSDGRNPLHVWRQNYMWNFFHILAFLPVGAIIALLYANSGVWTIALFIIPLFLARYSFQLYLDMREAHINTVAALTSAIDASDPFTHGHSFRVSRYALRVGRAMGMSSRDLEMLEYAVAPPRHRQDRGQGEHPQQAHHPGRRGVLPHLRPPRHQCQDPVADPAGQGHSRLREAPP